MFFTLLIGCEYVSSPYHHGLSSKFELHLFEIFAIILGDA
jgi:hypothetical protein